MKNNWKSVVAVFALVLVVGGIIYYVNGVYLPAKQAEKAEELRGDAQEVDSTAERPTVEVDSYDYTITVPPKASNAPANAEASETAASVAPVEISESGAVANIGSGAGESIVGEDGIYHGEPVEVTPSPVPATPALPVQTVGPTPTPPPAIESVAPTATQATPSPAPEASPVATATPSAPAQQPTGGGNSDTPKQGDTSTVDGQQQMWVDGWGWVPVGSGNTQEYFEMDSSGEYVGEFG